MSYHMNTRKDANKGKAIVRDLKIKVCPKCGCELHSNDRVRISFMWEFEDTKLAGHHKLHFTNSKSSSKYFCRKCATMFSYEVGIPKPKELL